MDGRLNKKLILITIKYGSWLIGIAYLIQVILSCFLMQSFIFSVLFSTSIFSVTLLCLFSYFLGFCIWNRLPLYYALSCNIINIIDYYIGIPVTNMWMLIIYLILLGIFIMFGAYIKNKKNNEQRTFNKNSA